MSVNRKGGVNEQIPSCPLIGLLVPRSASDWLVMFGLWELVMVCEATASLLAVENCEATVRFKYVGLGLLQFWD